MTSIRFTRSAKSSVAFAVSLSLFLTSAGGPASRAFAQAFTARPAGQAGSAVRAIPGTASGSFSPVSALPGGAALAPALSLSGAASAAPAAARASAAAASAAPASAASFGAAARAAAVAADASDPATNGEQAAPAAKPAGDSGPRWVGGAKSDDGAKKGGGPRWVGSARAVKGWIARQFPRWSRADAAVSRQAFDGGASRGGVADPAAPVAGADSARASALTKPADAAQRVIADYSIPTPEAARRVGEIRHEHGTPLWAKVAAPVAVIAAAAAAVHFGAVAVLTLAAGLVVSVLAHEVSHLAVLKALGDKTAVHAGEHSLNPFHHIDAVKTVIVPAVTLALSSALLPFPVLIGAGKPVNADFNNLRGPLGGPRSARNAFWVAAAGPLTNFAIAGLALGAAALLPAGGVLAGVAVALAHMNVALGIFNLLPLPQLDGGKMLASVLPEAWYAKWVYNPNVEKGYQGLFRRLYEGPANLLTFVGEKLGIKSQTALNRAANVVTFGALAAFYAVAYFHFSLAVPLLFLALPCTYDYWCIREKVRSEAAVKDVMDIFSQWSAVIETIADDHGLKSEVSQFETEHAMKNALETLIDEMMAKEEFRALSTDEKIAKLMAAYPDRAADFLKDKVFTDAADTKEKILQMLHDQRNTPFYERLRRWLAEHDIFDRWDNPAYEGKLRDQMKQAEKPKQKQNGQRGSTTLGMVGFLALVGGASLLFPGLHGLAFAGGLGLAGVLGSLAPSGAGRPGWFSKLTLRRSGPGTNIYVRFKAGTMAEAARHALRQYPNAQGVGAGARIVFKLTAPDARIAADIAADLGPLELVDLVSVPESVYEAITGDEAPRATDPPAPVSQADGAADDGRQGTLPFPGGSPAASENPAAAPENPAAAPETTAPAPETPAAQAPAAPTAEEIAAAAAAALDERDWKTKIAPARDEEEVDANEAVVVLDPALPEDVRAKVSANIAEYDHVLRTNERDGKLVLTLRYAVDDYVDVARNVARLKAVHRVSVPTDTLDRMFATALPEKIKSHGKEQYSTGAVFVTFKGEATEADIKETLGKLGEKRLFKYGDAYVLYAGTAEKAAEAAKELAHNELVAGVETHPNVAAALENRVKRPYPDAANYDPMRAFVVQFKDGVTPEEMAAYAGMRRVRVVYPDFRGKTRLALIEVLNGADPVVTRQMLVDETLDPETKVAEIRPLKEQPGEAALVPSAAAVAAAEARKAAAAAAEAAKNHKARRDPAAEWISYLQTRKLQDGTNLTDKQIQALASFLKPVARHPDDRRPPVVGRTEEVKRALPILTSPRGMRNSVIVIGEAGTGKTAVAEGLAEMIEDAEDASANDPETFRQFKRLKGRWLVNLDLTELMRAEDPVGALAMILKMLPLLNDKDRSRGNEVIVLMDEIQTIFGDPQVGFKMMNTIKGPIRDGNVSVIATTTLKEYKAYIEKDDALRRRFEPITIEPTNVDQTTRILRAIKSWLEKLHDALIPDEVLVASAKLTDQFDKTNFNPDKAIKAVQDAAERIRPENLDTTIGLDIEETWRELTYAVNEARQALADKGIPSTLSLPIEMYNRVVELIKKSVGLYEERDAVEEGRGRLSVDVVKKVIAQKTGIGSGQLNMAEEDAARYVKMEEEVGKSVVNQDRAIGAIADAIRRNKAGLSNPNRPMGKFLLVGPTGVGKTYLAKQLAKFLFNDPEAMVRFDMSEFMEEHAAMRLTGAPPSYVGYGEGGQLTEAVRKKPYSVILFDEVEKAHPKVFDLLLQILDDGRLTDGEGRTVDFKNTVILMTSNAGMSAVDGPEFVRRIRAAKAAGDFSKVASIEKEWDADIDAQIAEAIHGRFRPEFLNRLDDGPVTEDEAAAAQKDDSKKVKWVRVNRLREQDMEKIARLQVKEFQGLLADRHDTDLIVGDDVIDFLSEQGYSPLYGARPMTGAIEKNIIDPLAKWILEEAASGNKTVRGGLIRVSMKDGKVAFAAEVKPEKKLERSAVKDAAASMAAEVFSLVERLAADEGGEEPSEGLFDKLLRAARPAAKTPETAGPAAPAARVLLAPDTALSLPAGAPSAALTDKAATTAAIKAAVESVSAAGWPQSVSEVLQTPAGTTGEGWLKQFVAFAKDRARKAGAAAPVELVSSADGSYARLLVHMDAELSAEDKAFLAAHFTGVPPASFEAAQQYVDNLAPTSGIVRNHHLLDLYRRLSAVPGARLGYVSGAAARGGKGADLWLEIRKAEPAKPVESAPAARQDAKPTPHQNREMAKTRELLMRFVDQSRLPESDQDGPAIRVAAAEGYARLATEADAAEARQWVETYGWAKPGNGMMGIKARNYLVMAAALVLQRFGTAEDIPALEMITRKYNDYGHFQVPIHQALTRALEELYVRSGIAAVREAAVRAAQIATGDEEKNDKDIQDAVARALGRVGYPGDASDAARDPEGVADLYERMGKADELRADFYDFNTFTRLGALKRAALILVGRDPNPRPEVFDRLANTMRSVETFGEDSRRMGYLAAQAWANLAARTGRTKGLAQAIADYRRKHDISQADASWAILYAYVLAAEQAGGPEVLGQLEELMKTDPGRIYYNFEQVSFALPEAWAKALIRTGKFAEYSRRTLGEDGSPQPSRLEQMLLVKDRPMLVAGALRAIALARDPSYKAPAPAAAETDVPAMDAPAGSHGGGYMAHRGYRHDYLMRRFDERMPPAF